MDNASTAILTVAIAAFLWQLPFIFYRIRTAVYTYTGAIIAEAEETEDWDLISVPEPQPEPHTSATHYLTAAQGLSHHLSPAQRRALWKRARKYITRAILLRRRFWLAGDRLKNPRLQDLYKGIERVRGIVKRVRNANTGARITRNR
jgi:hypothetical protein